MSLAIDLEDAMRGNDMENADAQGSGSAAGRASRRDFAGAGVPTAGLLPRWLKAWYLRKRIKSAAMDQHRYIADERHAQRQQQVIARELADMKHQLRALEA